VCAARGLRNSYCVWEEVEEGEEEEEEEEEEE
jgi:hypothetical protein